MKNYTYQNYTGFKLYMANTAKLAWRRKIKIGNGYDVLDS